MYFPLFISITMLSAEDPKYCDHDKVIEQIELAHPWLKNSADYIFKLSKQYGTENSERDIIYKITTAFHNEILS